MAKVIWARYEDCDNELRVETGLFCKAPRHGTNIVVRKWIAVFVDVPDEEDIIVMPYCDECMGIIAKDFGTTPEDGARKP